MTSLHDQTVPVLIKFLNNFDFILKKGETWATEQNKSHEELLAAQIHPDMKGSIPAVLRQNTLFDTCSSLLYQVQSTCNTVRMSLERLTKEEHVVIEDNEKTFADCYARIASTIDYLKALDPTALENAGPPSDEIIMSTPRMGSFRFETRQKYVSEYLMPWVFFHITTAYNILRMQGCPVGAFDFLKDVFTKV